MEILNSYVAFDLETTGLNPKSDRIIEIGAVKIVDGKPAEIFETLVNPGMRISGRITEITGIDNEMAAKGKKTEEAVKEFIDFCGDHVLLGHNLMFDYSFMKRSAVNSGMSFEKTGIDTLKIARKTLPDLESRTLGYLSSYFRLSHENKHRAYSDALATALLYQRLAEDFWEEEKEIFRPQPLIYPVKKEGPITKRQKAYLNDLMKYHKIDITVGIDTLTKNEASRLIDKILFNNGKLPTGQI